MKGVAGFVTVNALLVLANVVAAGVIQVLADLALEAAPEAAASLPAYVAIGLTGAGCAVLFMIGAATAIQQGPWNFRRMRPWKAS